MVFDRLVVEIFGGRPWGFSIKGGMENSKPLVVSKLERDGKAEVGGLCIGDVLISVNDIELTGFRDEAVHLIRSSGEVLALEIDRNVLYRQAGVPLAQSNSGPQYQVDDDYYTSHISEQKYCDEYQPSMQNLTRVPFNEHVYQPHIYTTNRSPSPHEQYFSPPDVALYSDDESWRFVEIPDAISRDSRASNPDFADDLSSKCYKNEYPSQPIVKLRTRKARDRGVVVVERPRSWHSSKSANFVSHQQEDPMRSPESGYAYNPHSCHRLAQPKNRQSKGWNESGDLKSVYKPELTDSKESLSSGPQRSSKSARLSVSSSRSSGTISSSKGSMENLLKEAGSQQRDLESNPRIIFSCGSSQFKSDSPSLPITGIVSQQRSIFERLSQNATSPGPEPKMNDFSSRRISSESSDKKCWYHSSHNRENSRSPSQSSGGSSRLSSVTSPPVFLIPEKETRHRKRSYEKAADMPVVPKHDSYRASFPKKNTSPTVSSEGKQAEMQSQQQYRTSTLSPSFRRDDCSFKTVGNHHKHSKSYSALSALAYQDSNCASKFQFPDPNDSCQDQFRSTIKVTSRIPVSNTDSSSSAATNDTKKQRAPAERVFGVVSSGKNGSIAAKSMTMPSKVKDFDTTLVKSCKADNKNDQIRNFSKYPDSRSTLPTGSEHCSKEHTKSVSADSNGKGRYGSVWKTPSGEKSVVRNHRRAKSSDFTNVLKEWSEKDSYSAVPSTMPVFEPKKSDEATEWGLKMSPTTENREQSFNISSDLPSILKSLQNSQNGESLYHNLEPKSFTKNFDKASDSKQKENHEITSTNIPWTNKKKTHSVMSDWKSQFKEIDLDEHSDESCSPQDRYIYDIKDMSKKVLRVTSFTRIDLGVPSLHPVNGKRTRFPFPDETQLLQPSTISHSRSRSHGSELEESSDTLSNRSEKKESSQPAKPRPKSAGVTRSSNRHAPVLRANVAPSCDRPASYYGRKSESLPRNSSLSFELEHMGSPVLEHLGSPTPSIKAPSPLSKASDANVNCSVSTPVEKMNKKNTRNAIIDYVTRKKGISFDSSDHSLASPSTFHSLRDDDSDKKTGFKSEEKDKRKASRDDRSFFLSNSRNEKSAEILPNRERTTNEKHTLKEESPNSHQQSSASLLDEEENFQRSERTPSLTSGERSASFDNLTDSGLDMSRASPSEHCDVEHMPLSRSEDFTPSTFDSLATKHELIKLPLRKHPKSHRQRFSNSSSASSATTISTLSSFSSASSASIGKFPALGEEAEQPELNHTTQSSPIKDLTAKSLLPLSPLCKSPAPTANRVLFDTNTFRVAKRKTEKSLDFPLNEPGKNVEIHRSTKTIVMSPPPSSMSDDIAQHNQENKKVELEKKEKTGASNVLTSKETLLEVQQNVCKIIEKVKQSASIRNPKVSAAVPSRISPPPSPSSLPHPLDGAAKQLLNAIAQQRKLDDTDDAKPKASLPSTTTLETAGKRDESVQLLSKPLGDATSLPNPPTTASLQQATRAFPTLEHSKDVTSDANSDSDTNFKSENPTDSEVVRKPLDIGLDDRQFKPIRSPLHQSPPSITPPPQIRVLNEHGLISSPEMGSLVETEIDEPPLVSPVPLLPDVSLLPDSVKTSLQEDHPELTQDIIKGDKALAQVFSAESKKTSDYMEGILAQPSYDIIEQGMRYRRRKPLGMNFEFEMNNNNNSHFVNDARRNNLPASSTYYKTSASKGKILSLMKEKLADGEIELQEEETCDEMNKKKLELILSIKNKLDDLDNMKGLLDVEMRENECLGRQVCNLTKSVCSPKEQEKYNIFVQDVDKIINLLLSLSGRLARVENTIQMLPMDADKQEMNQLCEKRRKLTEQHKEAKQLKENIDRRQKIVSEILVKHFNREQFADYEHYIKMKSALIMEQRELDDKSKLGREQMQCLRDSLPEDWQSNLEKLIGE